jgi:Putative DNA-binding domain
MLEQDFNAGLLGEAKPHVRFPIYQNNISQGLINSLRVRFPVAEQLVGSAFFTAMAGAYVAACKPTSAVLIYYGASFGKFVADYEPAKSLPYLPELVQFENTWWHAYHAAEASPLTIAALSEVAPEEWGNLKFQFHPSVKLFHAKQSAATIWQWHQIANNSERLGERSEEFVIVSRPHAEVDVRLIAADAFAFLAHLENGLNLETALAETLKSHPNFDLQLMLGALFQLELIIGVTT